MTAGIIAMDRTTTRKLRFYLRLHYPMQVTAGGDGFAGVYPDLPGCRCTQVQLPDLYAELEQIRRAWVTRQLLAGRDVPMPNSYTLRPLARAIPTATESPAPLAAIA